MIFVTVGSDVPFDRLIKAVDQWAGHCNIRDVFAQIGRGGWQPRFMAYANMLEPAEFRARLASSRIVIGHAGMGTILSALQMTKPILVMPRRGHLGETRNDHQMATAQQLRVMGKVNVAFDEHELCSCLDSLGSFTASQRISAYASPVLIEALRQFIHQR